MHHHYKLFEITMVCCGSDCFNFPFYFILLFGPQRVFNSLFEKVYRDSFSLNFMGILVSGKTNNITNGVIKHSKNLERRFKYEIYRHSKIPS